jgi:hypothetical protein
VAHFRIFSDIEIVDILDRGGQGIRLLVEQLGPFPLQVHIIFVIVQAVALAQVFFQNRHDFRWFGLKEMQRFDKSFDESVHSFLIVFYVIAGRQ